jgi:hypothetical protein
MKVIKSRKKARKQFFIIKFPDGKEALIKCCSWSGVAPYIRYLNAEYEDEISIVVIGWLEAIEFILKGRLFNASR